MFWEFVPFLTLRVNILLVTWRIFHYYHSNILRLTFTNDKVSLVAHSNSSKT